MDKTALFKIGYGLYVLTARVDECDSGCIINSVMQVTSGDNSKFLISVNKQNYTRDMILSSGIFNISILTTGAKFDIFERFGFRSGRDVDKFEGFGDVHRSKNGVLYITQNTNAYISFRVIDTIDCDTHTVFLAEVTDAKNIGSGDSVTYDYYHKNIKPKPEKQNTKGWRCTICGYIYDGDELPEDFVCPICKHDASYFEKITD